MYQKISRKQGKSTIYLKHVVHKNYFKVQVKSYNAPKIGQQTMFINPPHPLLLLQPPTASDPPLSHPTPPDNIPVSALNACLLCLPAFQISNLYVGYRAPVWGNYRVIQKLFFGAPLFFILILVAFVFFKLSFIKSLKPQILSHFFHRNVR